MIGLQVLDSNLGWEAFRKDYGASTWQWITAATDARFFIELKWNAIPFEWKFGLASEIPFDIIDEV